MYLKDNTTFYTIFLPFETFSGSLSILNLIFDEFKFFLFEKGLISMKSMVTFGSNLNFPVFTLWDEA